MAAAAGLFEDSTEAEDAIEEIGRNAFSHFDLEQQRCTSNDVGITSRVIHLRETGQGSGGATTLVNLDKELEPQQRELIVERALRTKDQDAEHFLKALRDRQLRVGCRPPAVEVRCESLRIEADVFADQSRNLPSIINAYRDCIEWVLVQLHLLRAARRKLVILNDITATIPAGRLTLLLGPPSCGKSTLLKALAGKLQRARDFKVTGNVTYNGRKFSEFLAESTSVYVPQDDQHMAELTVRETFSFASRCQGAGIYAELQKAVRKAEKEDGIDVDNDLEAFCKAAIIQGKKGNVMSEYVIQMLGLGICADTVVGVCWSNRVWEQAEVLSTSLPSSSANHGGTNSLEMKAVQYLTGCRGEMMAGPKRVLFMDEISTGLDSSTTYSITKWLRDLTHYQDYTILVSLLQPAPETYDLFDDIMLLANGTLIYHGPREQVMQFFNHIGFACPERKGIADFLQEVTSRKDQAQYRINSSLRGQFVTVPEMAQRFKEWSKAVDLGPSSSYERPASDEGLVHTKYALTRAELFKACLSREISLASRNMFLYCFRFIQTLIMGIITATLFLRTWLHPVGYNNGVLYLSVLFFSLIQIMFDGAVEMHLGVERLPGFYKQRDNMFYPAWCYVIPTSWLRIPYSFLDAFLWTAIVYYTVGLAPAFHRFLIFGILLFLLHQMGIGMFRLIAGLARDDKIASTGGSFFFLSILVLGGFLLSEDKIPPWWVWMYWINPINYAQRALALNEFLDPRWQNQYMPDGQSVGNAILMARAIPTDSKWISIGIAILIAATVLFNTGAWLTHAYLNPLEKPAVVLPPDEDEEIQAEAGQWPKKGPKSEGDNDGVISVNGQHMNGHAMSNGANNVCESSEIQLDSISEDKVDRKSGDGTSSSSNKSMELAPVTRRRLSLHLSPSGTTMQSQQEGEITIDHGMVLPFKPLSLTFENINYYVDLPKEMVTTDPEKAGPRVADVDSHKMLQLLQDCSGAFEPGVLTALVGVSGAGKTTLMDVLAGRKTSGVVKGEIRVGGFLKNQETFARVAGYVEQFDIHQPNTTVAEALWVSARLRTSDEINNVVLHAFVGEVLNLVELTPIRDVLVGIPGRSGLSVEQRKRLTIAVELVANPSIIFMDEPTSGLDARAAAIVMRTVRNTVDTGRTVVCTIHQPSIDIFEAFDDLLLMKVGGEIIFHGPLGPKSSDLVAYFEDIPGVPRLTPGLNPATWMLQITTPAAEERIGVDFAAVYRSSLLAKATEKRIHDLTQVPTGAHDLAFLNKYPQSQWNQFVLLLRRNFVSYWRDPAYNGTRFVFALIMALLFGTILWQIGDTRAHIQDVYNILGALYLAVLFLAIINAMTVQPVVALGRIVSWRERAAGMYDPLPFALAQCAVEIPYNVVQCILFCCVSYFMIGFETSAAKFFWYFLTIFITLNLMTFYGVAAVYLTPDIALANVLSGTFYGLWNLFAGFLIGYAQMPPWWSWYWFLNPISWTLYAIIVTQLGDVTTPVDFPDGSQKPMNEFLQDTFGYDYSFREVSLASWLSLWSALLV
eukprot:jgi/Botrbrau1/9730/Bobra.0388s0022.1